MQRTHRAWRLLIVAGIFLCPNPGSAQEIQNAVSYRGMPYEGYFRFNYENDVFFGTDKYYTQGVHFELQHPRLYFSFIRRIFPHLNGALVRCGIGLESAGYSPTSIVADSILYGDHPFAGMAYVKLFRKSVQVEKKRRLTGTLSLGWMGPAAGGYEIQSAIHKVVGSPEPLGWKYQLKDQPVINYELNFEQDLRSAPKWLTLSAWAMVRAGTLSNKASIGGIVGAAWKPRSRTVVYGYAHPAISLIGYEAVLQGGPFTKDNPYRIPDGDISRIVGSGIAGVNIRDGKLSIGAYARWRTATFRTGTSQALGGLTFAVGF